MPISITMPALSPTMEEGVVAKWLVKEGDVVSSGDIIAEVETDKATMEVEAVDEGIVGQILVKEGGDPVPVNKVIAVLLEEGESRDSLNDHVDESKKLPTKKKKSTEKTAQNQKLSEIKNTSDSAVKINSTNQKETSRVFASPLAKRMALKAGINLDSVKGSGPNGRIIKSDIDSLLDQTNSTLDKTNQSKISFKDPEGNLKQNNLPSFIEVPNTNMRKIIADRLTDSKRNVPHFYMTVDCEIDSLLELRKELNNRSKEGSFKLSVNDFIIGASALALSKVPDANASWTEKSILKYSSVDVSVAVALENGLVTPVIRNADQKGLAEISNEMKDLIIRARSNKLMPEEYQGGTFSISNLGMYGIKHFAAVINPPQGAILAIGSGKQQPVVKDGALSIATIMHCTLSCDHRVVDGAVGARFLDCFKGFIEDPVTMML